MWRCLGWLETWEVTGRGTGFEIQHPFVYTVKTFYDAEITLWEMSVRLLCVFVVLNRLPS